MILDIKFTKGDVDLVMSQFETYEELVSNLCALSDCIEDDLRKKLCEDYQISVLYYGGWLCNLYVPSLAQLFNFYQKLSEYEDNDQEIIIGYLYNIDDIPSNNMNDAFDYYFGIYDSDYEVAEDILSEYLGMNRSQINYVLDKLDCADKVVAEACYRFENRYYLK